MTNWDTVDTRDYLEVPGWYQSTVTSVNIQDGGDWQVYFTVDEGPEAGAMTSEFMRPNGNPPSQGRFKSMFGKLGVILSGTQQPDVADIIGKTCYIGCEWNSYNDRVRLRIAWNGFRSIEQGPGAPFAVEKPGIEPEAEDEEPPF